MDPYEPSQDAHNAHKQNAPTHCDSKQYITTYTQDVYFKTL
jgi:hypothetical protein